MAWVYISQVIVAHRMPAIAGLVAQPVWMIDRCSRTPAGTRPARWADVRRRILENCMRALPVLMAAGVSLLTLGGCVTISVPPLPTPMLPPMVWGDYLDNDTGAINFAAWAFASPGNTRGNPIEAARGIIALEYLSGELADNPRWVRIDAAVKLRLRLARDEVRQAMGIRPDAPPQAVVNALLAFVGDMQWGNQPAAVAVLAEPLFIRGPQATFDTLSNLPYLQQANLATARAAAQAMYGGGLSG
jgi:hypothetical protein